MERGQVLVVVALAAVGIIAIIGLTIDVGLMFIGNARLRRAVDAAALAAALQYRQNTTNADPNILKTNLTDSANEFLILNGITNPNSDVHFCYTDPGDPTLCPTAGSPARKLVRVHATAQVKLAFLPVIGIDQVTISATAVSEAASLDVVLVIDRSESMTYGTDLNNILPTTDPMRDPFYCNGVAGAHGDIGSCQPFDSVIDAAVGFTQILFFPYDQIAIVTFDKEPGVLSGGNRVPNLALNADCPDPSLPCDVNQVVIPTLRNLTVYEGDETVDGGSANAIYPNGSPSRCYGPWACSPDVCSAPPQWSPSSNYQTLVGPNMDPCNPPNAHYVNPPDISQYTTTNIGGGLEMAGNEFSSDSRQNSLWVVILLTDGVANAGYSVKDGVTTYFCPEATWGLNPACNLGNPSVRHKAVLSDGTPNPDYDASDFAYDMADFVGKKYPDGQGALIYTIGLGNQVTANKQPGYADPYSYPIPGVHNEGLGTIFLNYAAAIGNGQAFYAAQPADLLNIFRDIGSNIATRLAK
jgi:Flp pilus assembly protein TadG